MLRFVFSLSMVSLFLPLPSYAYWEGCEEKVREWITTKRDRYILDHNKFLLSVTEIANCDQDLGISLMIAVHEGVHFLDYNLNSIEQFAVKDFTPSNVELFLTDMSRLKASDVDLPSPYYVFESLGFSYKPITDFKNNELINDDYIEYILDQKTFSSINGIWGLGSEINAYAHGTLLGFSILRNTEELENVKNYGDQGVGPFKTQRTGLIGFTSLVSSYLHILSKKDIKSWNLITTNSELKLFYKRLMEQSFNVLDQTRNCGAVTEYELGFVFILEKSLNENILKEIEVQHSKKDFISAARCEKL